VLLVDPHLITSHYPKLRFFKQCCWNV